MNALHVVLDAERRNRHLSWTELAAEINLPFRGTSSLPISVTTIKNMLTKRSVTSAVVLQILRWLGRTPESFLSGRNTAAAPSESLPVVGPHRILRFDTRAMYAALNAERTRKGMTWRQVAGELPGFTASMLANLATGPLIGFPLVMMITRWLCLPAASFVRDRGG
jgi:transcriptional regulator with XRE-family HTH domain